MRFLSPLTLAPMAIAEDATTPEPAGGAGSAAWSTLLTAPVFWDGLAWRTIGHFSVSDEIPSWVPENAVIAADFVNGQYWRSDIGICDAADIFNGDLDWWWDEDGPDQFDDIVPGLGLTTGPTLTPWTPHATLTLNAAAHALAFDDGFCVAGECLVSSASPLTGLDDGGVTATLVTNPGYYPNMQAVMQKTASGSKMQFVSNYDTGSAPQPFSSPEHFFFAVNLDLPNSTFSGAINGDALPSFTDVDDYSAANTILVGANASSQSGVNAVTSTLRRMIFFPQQDQAALNTLSTPPAPANLSPPTISGLAQVTETLTASTGTWTIPPTTYAYQWRADGVDIAGATAATHVLTEDELGAVITVAMIASNAGGESSEAVSAGTASVTAAPSSLDLDFTTGTLPAGVTLSRTSSGTYFNASGVLTLAATNVARFDHDPVTLAPLGLLIEPAATNLIANSAVLTSYLVNSRSSWSADVGLAPDGTTTADKLTENTENGWHIAYQARSTTIGTQYTLSAHAAPNGRNFAALAMGSGTDNFGGAFDLVGGVVGTTSAAPPAGASRAIIGSGAGFRRLSLTRLVTSVTTYMDFCISDSASPAVWDSGRPRWAGDGSSGINLWGAQLEVGPKATSYIPTTGSTATRAADQLSFTIPTGVATLRYTFDDNSTQDVSVSPGAYNVPTNLNRARIKTIRGL